MNSPQYRDIRRKLIPAVKDGGASVHVLSGSFKGGQRMVR
jgi:redox-sensitive bicupin YhaK (pirin superfamily)